MSSAKFSMHVDKDLQIIRQNIEGIVDEEDANSISIMTETLAKELKEPRKVRILAVSNDFGKGTTKARKRLLENLDQADLYKIAVMGKNPYMKTLFSFFLKVTGSKKVMVFISEQDAVRWLNE
jgi:hypothetical protein